MGQRGGTGSRSASSLVEPHLLTASVKRLTVGVSWQMAAMVAGTMPCSSGSAR